MAYPTKPSIQTSYTAVEQAQGDGLLPGQELDVDFANLKTAIDALNDFVRGVTRSDGRLGNNTVTRDSLAADILLGLAPPEPWQASRAYQTPASVFIDNKFYLALTEHTSTVFVEDLEAGRWVELADFTQVQAAAIAAQAAAEAARNDVLDAKADIDAKYLGSFDSAPATAPDFTPLEAGMLYFDTTARTLFVYSGTNWIAASSSIAGVRQTFNFTATAAQTVFSGPDDNADTLVFDNAELVSVFVNGVRLVSGVGYTVSVPGDEITLAAGATAGDSVQIEVFGNLNANPPEGVNVSQIIVNTALFTGGASQAQAEAGANNSTLMTPLRTRQAVDARAAPLTRTLTAGLGLTGLGDLSANRSVAIDRATVGEAEAGASNTKVMTPLRVAQHRDVTALGWGQTWENLTSERSYDTSYQNTTGKPILVSVRKGAEDGARQSRVSANGVNFTVVASTTPRSFSSVTFLVPADHFYRVEGGAGTPTIWAELR